MNARFVPLAFIAFHLTACGVSDWDTFMGNPKHVCDYKEYASATVENRSSRPVAVQFCGESEKPLQMGGVVANDGAPHAFAVLIAHSYDEYHDSAAEPCGVKGIPSGTYYGTGYYASLAPADLTTTGLCLNHHGDAADPLTHKKDPERYLLVDKGAACPAGFQAYDQSANPCAPQ